MCFETIDIKGNTPFYENCYGYCFEANQSVNLIHLIFYEILTMLLIFFLIKLGMHVNSDYSSASVHHLTPSIC